MHVYVHDHVNLFVQLLYAAAEEVGKVGGFNIESVE